jgi:hypothetical protein
MKGEIHIFICFNPMPNIYIANLIAQLEIKTYRVIEFYSKPVITTVDPGYLKRFNHHNKILYARDIRSAVKYILSIIQPYQNVTFYFSHPFNAVANYFFFRDDPSYHYIQIPDGIANYYQITTRSFILKMILKKIVGWLIGIPYSLYFTHLTGIMESKFDQIITFHETGLIHNGQEIIKLKLDWALQKSTVEKRNKILILGQSYKNFMIYYNTYEQIFKYIQVTYGTNYDIVYKCHPNEVVTSRFAALLHRYHISILDRKEQVEFFALEYGIIISEASSALLNIKIIYGDQVHCIAFIKNKKYLSGRRFKQKQIIEIKERLHRTGVQLIE